jgi:hypothetical protein
MVFEHFLPVFLTVLARASDKVDKTQKGTALDPNLRLRPHAPAKGRGRLQVQIRWAFMVGGPVLSSSAIYDWTHARRRARLPSGHRHSVPRILRGRSPGRPRSNDWPAVAVAAAQQ